MSKGARGLNEVWKKRGIDRVLFFTYSFDFYWFHNYVLPRIRMHSNSGAEVLVIASKIDGNNKSDIIGGWGDQYHLKDWMPWGARFNVVYLPNRPLFHSKFVVITRKDELTIGMGSANLTPGGWNSNLESWSWEQERHAGNISDFLSELAAKNWIDRRLLEKSMGDLKKSKVRKTNSWLYGSDKKKAAKNIIESLKPMVNQPTVLRVVSPYFDEGSKGVLAMFSELFPKDIKKEFWIDRSGKHATLKDFNHLNLINSDFANCQFKSIKQRHEKVVTVETQKPIHAKVIEVESMNGEGVRIFGSANFTGAAWLGSNYESITVEKYKSGENFLGCLNEDLKNGVYNIAIKDLTKPEIKQENEQKDGRLLPIFYWAIYSERETEIKAHVFFPKGITLVKCRIEARHNPQRDLDSSPEGSEELETLTEIENEFQDKKNWGEPSLSDDGVLTVVGNSNLRTPEMLRMKLSLSDGTEISCQVLPVPPNFEDRDKSTGIPKHNLTVVDLLDETKPIVRPVCTTPIIDDEDQEDDEFEDEEVISIIPELSSLSESPEFNHLPDAIKIIKKIKKEKDFSERKESIVRLLKKFSKATKIKKQKVIADALLEALDG